MRRIFLIALALCAASLVFAQTDSTVRVKRSTPKAGIRSADHFLVQLGYNSWAGKPDSIHTKGFPHTLNAYLMFDFPFKTNPRMSVGIGPGIATDQQYFDKMNVGVAGTTTTLRFRNVSDTTNFKRNKLTMVYAEAPVELRYRSSTDDAHAFKVALGVKVGFLLNTRFKQKDQQSSAGTLENSYTQKIASTRYFNSTRLSGSLRVGYGHWSLYGQYALTPLFKEGVGPKINPVTFGLTLSGL